MLDFLLCFFILTYSGFSRLVPMKHHILLLALDNNYSRIGFFLKILEAIRLIALTLYLRTYLRFHNFKLQSLMF